MGGIEQVINLYKEQLVPKVPHILKVRLLAIEGLGLKFKGRGLNPIWINVPSLVPHVLGI